MLFVLSFVIMEAAGLDVFVSVSVCVDVECVGGRSGGGVGLDLKTILLRRVGKRMPRGQRSQRMGLLMRLVQAQPLLQPEAT